MGNKPTSAALTRADPSEEYWPWVWAIRDPEQLDWKRGLEDDPAALARISARQYPLPVPLDVVPLDVVAEGGGGGDGGGDGGTADTRARGADDAGGGAATAADGAATGAPRATRAASFLWLGDAACARKAAQLDRRVPQRHRFRPGR